MSIFLNRSAQPCLLKIKGDQQGYAPPSTLNPSTLNPSGSAPSAKTLQQIPLGQTDQIHPRQELPTQKRPVAGICWTVLIGLIAFGGDLGWMPHPALAAPVLNPRIKVGIQQRFGAKLTDKLSIEALPGDQLTLQFLTEGKVQTLRTNKVEFAIMGQPLAQPVWQERVVLSNHRSFESAETKAQKMSKQGIAVEIAQPEQWQVWAKGDRYPTPADRLLLLETLKQKGEKTAFLSRQLLKQRPQLSWVVKGYRYNRDIVSISSQKQQFKLKDQRHAGNLRFQPNAYGSYTLVNQVPIETYLRGVVPYEIGFGAPETAVQAQTIIARTYALRNLRRFKIDNYELCADTQCQVYNGIAQTDPRVDRAITSTAGQVLTYQNELVDALYSSTTGGVTAAFEDVWEGEPRPYLVTKIDAAPNGVWDLKTKPLADEAELRRFIQLKQGFNESSWPTFRWQRQVSLAALNQQLRSYLQKNKHALAKFKTIQELKVTKRSAGGRVQTLAVTTDLGEVELHKDEVLRGFDDPQNLLFYLEPNYQAATTAKPSGAKTLKGYRFIGGGFGHGVGLSQTGSYRLSEIGWPAPKILSFYYPGTQVQPLTSNIVYWQEPGGVTALPSSAPGKPSGPSSPKPSQRWMSDRLPLLKSFAWALDWLAFL